MLEVRLQKETKCRCGREIVVTEEQFEKLLNRLRRGPSQQIIIDCKCKEWQYVFTV